MSLKELQDKLTRFQVAAETSLKDAEKLIDEEKFSDAEAKQAEADGYMKNADVIRKQIESMKSSTPDPEPEPEPQTTKTAARLPFTEDNDGGDEDENRIEKAVHILRFGDVNKQAEVLLHELYGNDYASKRSQQKAVFAKYLRTGRFNNVEEEKLLKTAILLPNQVEDGVRQDVSYKTMKATLQEVSGELGGYEKNVFTANMDNRTIAFA